MIKTEDFKKQQIESQEELRSWLLKHHGQEESIWLVTLKKSEGSKYVSREQVLDELISFGWIDGIRRKLDDTRTMQLISPRKVQHWSGSYKTRAARLIEDGLMHEAGLKSIEDGKQSGLWHFMDDVDKLIVPDDLRVALSRKREAELFFEQINDSSKRFALRWLKLSKTDKTRLARIAKIVSLSAQGKKLPGS